MYGGGLAPPTQEVGCVVVVECHQRHCVPFGVDQCIIGIVDFWWLVEISWRMGLLEEQDGDVFLPLPASDPLSILNAHFCL